MLTSHNYASIALACLVAAAARPADACSCGRPDRDTGYKQAVAVIVAKVVDRVGPAPGAGSHGDIIFELDVESVWKGSVKRKARIATGASGLGCGRALEKGSRWIFFAPQEQSPGVLHTSMCDHSELATKEALEAMTKKFGAPKPSK